MPPSRDEIIAAFNSLSEEEKRRLKRYAHYRMAFVRGIVHDSDADDLYNEAVARTLEGTRKWKPVRRKIVERTIFEHLVRTMSSIANELAKRGVKFTGLLGEHEAEGPDKAAVEAREKTDRLRLRLQGDLPALNVLETMLDDKRPAEALKILNIPPNVYAAARKRIFRHAQRLFGPREDNET
jgi:hypothetical protein